MPICKKKKKKNRKGTNTFSMAPLLWTGRTIIQYMADVADVGLILLATTGQKIIQAEINILKTKKKHS